MGKKKAGPPEGVQFPVTDASTGKRSTQQAGRDIFAAALRDASKEVSDKCQNLPARKWRGGYRKFVMESVKLGTDTPKNAISIATSGLEAAHNKFEFVRPAGSKAISLGEAMQKYGKHNFKTKTIKGTGKAGRLKIPYKGTDLRGQALIDQIDKWVNYGTIEETCGNAIKSVAQRCPDLSNTHFVLLGAGSAMGPFNVLMELGANVVAIDLGPAQRDSGSMPPNGNFKQYSFMERGWNRLIETAKKSAGTLTFPITPHPKYTSDADLAKVAGGDLLLQTPEIAQWLSELPFDNLVIGAYAYLDGELFVKLAIAMDAIIGAVSKARRNKPAIAFLCTPTDIHVIPEQCNKEMKRNWDNAPCWQKIVRFIPGLLQPNAHKKFVRGSQDGKMYHIVDALVNRQGCNYALAKRLQHWRAMKHRHDGGVVSTNIAPASTTASVLSNKLFEASYGGMKNFRPLEVFDQNVSNHVMTALLLHDITTKTGAANPDTKLANPLMLFSEGAFHGGIWRCAYTLDTLGGVSAGIFFLNKFKLIVVGIVLLFLYFFCPCAFFGLV